jgi:hypothetical protein
MGEEELKLADASWHKPILGVECPHCGQWDDRWEDLRESLEPFVSVDDKKDLEHIEITCNYGDCMKPFGLSSVQY